MLWRIRGACPFQTRPAISARIMSELGPAPRAPVPAERVNARLRGAARTAFPFVVVGAAWEALAHAGLFPPRLFPPLETVAAALARLTATGILLHHAAETVLRLAAGFALATVIGVALGIVMGRSRRAEDIAPRRGGMGARA